MIIPVRCMNCGKLLADKYDYYQRRLREEKGVKSSEPTYFVGKAIGDTDEAKVMKEIGLTRYCCKKTFLTHVDLIEKI